MKLKAKAGAAMALGALLFLGSCNFGPIPAEENGEAGSMAEIAVSASPWTGPAAGEYFNAREGISLRLDGAGGFVLASSAGRAEGSCSGAEDELVLSCGGEELRAYPRSGGLVLQGVAGLFLPLETLGDFSALELAAACDREYVQGEDGRASLRDYGLGLGLSYPGEMSAPENLLTDAVVIWDRSQGYVTGRNVTEAFNGEGGEEFLASYMERRLPEDFRLLYGAEGALESMAMLDEGVSGRLASGEGLLRGGGLSIYVKAIMYTSTYADGTVNYICKCFFAPEGDTRCFNALANGVVELSAVRRN